MSRTYSFDAVNVVTGEFWVVRGLDRFINQTIDDSESVEFELNALHSTIGDFFGSVWKNSRRTANVIL